MPKSRQLPVSYSHSRRWTVDEAQIVLAAQAASGLSVAAFAAREGVDAQRLYFWRRRAGTSTVHGAGTPVFVEVRGPVQRERVEIVLRSGRTLRVAESIETANLQRLVDVLEREPAC